MAHYYYQFLNQFSQQILLELNLCFVLPLFDKKKDSLDNFINLIIILKLTHNIKKYLHFLQNVSF